MNHHNATPLLAGAGVLILLLLSADVRGQQLSVGQVEAKWRALEMTERSGVTYAVEQKYSVGGRERPTFNWVVESSSETGKASRGREQVLVWNGQYTFALVTKERSADFLLNGLTIGSPGMENEVYSQFIKMNTMHGHILHPSTYLLDGTAADMLATGRLKIERVKSMESDQRVALEGRIDFSQRVGPKVSSTFAAVIDERDGRFHKVTTRVTAFDGKPPPSADIVSTWEYDYNATVAGATLRRLKYTSSDITAQFIYTPAVKYTAPLESYRTTHYGIPEPPGIIWERPTPTYVWLLLATGGFGVITLACRWLLKRRAKAVLPPVPPTA